ncbi:CBS domain-containing protein [Mesorhizobium sp.]|uniref:CBS domain-containing protein n=1 Tax=Mesorhizobium sp. TaxID=1871066 RepID=UPI0011F595DA|nr:CBS domain-containing protein [Mesorhizobium sp.]TIO05488.1 MAG: CBS domain-containing protein [Mesorhizobium sp.]TIO30420.1 MAG: CBS domain-containing protein [Mesorhizobium sp.]TIP12251.1 MAG: CBS domain-containing protein [Mesorhizobium sp.]
MKAKDVMTAKVVTVSPDHSVRHAARIMLDHRISGMPVVDDGGRVVGIVSEGDFLRRSELGAPALSSGEARGYVKGHGWKVADLMTSDVVVADEEIPIERIAVLMQEHCIKRIPVLRGPRLVGVVSRADLLRVVVAAKLDDATAAGDDAIRRSILTRLREDAGVNGDALILTVSDGLVHFSGAVGSQSERDAVRVVAEGVKGVKGVYDHLYLAHP